MHIQHLFISAILQLLLLLPLSLFSFLYLFELWTCVVFSGAGTQWESGVRRSTRIRCRPLEYWKGERLLYGRIHKSELTFQREQISYML